LIETVAETGSTNADLAARLRAGELVSEGFWLIADRQNAGRGRLGRVWDDGSAGSGLNFMGSTLVALGALGAQAGSLALVAGLAVQAAVEPFVPPPRYAVLKWPNDVLVGTAKLAGILLERVGEHVVIGIGVNLAHAPVIAGRETAALSAFGPAPDRDAFAQRLAGAMARELRLWRQAGRESGLPDVLRRWQERALPVGTALSVSQADGQPLCGIFSGLDPSGALLLRAADGTCQTVYAGDVSLI
jgi:BirA family biotin operon repressor/biotin-[acetyl-CoA-carboxylase] ligase